MIRLSDYTLAELVELQRRVTSQQQKALGESRRLGDLRLQITTAIRTRCYEANHLLDLRVVERKRRKRTEARSGD